MKKLLPFILIVFGFSFSAVVLAGASDNVSGWAWSENIGWISFNNTTGGGATSSYGVNINLSTGDLSGYSWSENVGWISFNRADTGNPPAAPYNGGSGPIANYDSASRRVRGWARALSYGGGWDGWIKLGDSAGVWPAGGPQVSIAVSNEFVGWAWGSDVVGWISFNDRDFDGSPGPYDYQVVVSSLNPPPTAINLSADAANPTDYCGITSYPPVRVRWQFSDAGDSQSAYQIQAFRASDGFKVVDTGKKSCIDCSAYVFQSAGEQLAWNTSYNWQIMVWDSSDLPSVGWIGGPSFTTISHAYPTPNFTFLPSNPAIEEVVIFTNTSQAYGGATISSNFWTITQGAGTFVDGTSANSSNPHIKFSTRDNRIKLQVADSSGYNCETEKIISATPPLPEWWEVPPVSWAKKFLAFITGFFRI
jgi:hypothetical protein